LQIKISSNDFILRFRWLQEAIAQNESTKPHGIEDILQQFPMQNRASSGGLRIPGCSLAFLEEPANSSNDKED
jgi:hypothetical protein